MAKTKKKKAQNQAPLSSDVYMRRVMRSLPVDKCYINPDWKEQGMAHVVIVRRRPDGKFAMVVYLVDTFCLGVKDAFWRTSLDKSELDAMIKNFEERIGIEECDYATAHNLILGAIEFAEEGGIKPCKEWMLGQYGLDEDTDDIPLIEFDYGLEGKHFLNTYTRSEGAKYIPILEAHLGDNFYCRFEEEEAANSLPEEEYLKPEGVEYPTELNLKHPEVAEILCSKDNVMVVPVDEMARIAAIDRDELLADLDQLAMYELGKVAGRVPSLDEEPGRIGSIPHCHDHEQPCRQPRSRHTAGCAAYATGNARLLFQRYRTSYIYICRQQLLRRKACRPQIIPQRAG